MTSTLTMAREIRGVGDIGEAVSARLIDLDLIATLAGAVVLDPGNEDKMNALEAELSALGKDGGK